MLVSEIEEFFRVKAILTAEIAVTRIAEVTIKAVETPLGNCLIVQTSSFFKT